jgi:putative transposase
MPKYRLYKGLHFELWGREYVVEQRLRTNHLQIKDVITNEFRSIAENKVFDAWISGDLRFLDDDRDSRLAQRKATKTYIQELSLLNDTDPKSKRIKTDFQRRWKYVKAIMDAHLGQTNEENIQPIIDIVAKTAGENGNPDINKPFWKTVLYRWVMPFLSCNKDFRVLVPGCRGRGNTKPKFTGTSKQGQTFTLDEKQKAENIKKIAIEVKDEKLIDGQRHTIGSICDAVYARISETNEFRDNADKLPRPHKSSLYRLLDRELDEYEKDRLRYGKDYADRRYRETKSGPILRRPLQRVEMDHTPLDMMVIDTDVMLPIGRPNFTSAIDVFTEMDLGFFASFGYPGYLAVMQCLKHAIMPKTYVRDRYPSVRHDWPCYGVPELVVVDNAPEFHGESFEEASVQLGFEIQYGPKGQAWFRGHVERGFRTKNTGWLHEQPGTTFSNILDRKDYDPKQNAVVSFNDFMEMAHIFMIDIYPRQRHRGIRVEKFPRQKLKDIEVVPALLWEKAIKEYPPGLPPSREELQVLIGEIQRRIIHSYGIEMDCLIYNCERLALLRRRTVDGGPIKLKRDPGNLNIIFAADEENGLYFPVPSQAPEYTKGLTLWQHKKILAFARQRAKDTVDIDELMRAKHMMQEIVERDWKKMKGSGARQRMANFKGIRQEDYGADHDKKKGKDIDISGKVQSDSNMVLLNSGAATLKGISDLVAPYVPTSYPRNGNNEDVHLASGGIKMVSDQKVARQRNRKEKPKRNASETKLHTTKRGESSKKVVDDHSDSGEKDLDVTGYKGSFDLPK